MTTHSKDKAYNCVQWQKTFGCNSKWRKDTHLLSWCAWCLSFLQRSCFFFPWTNTGRTHFGPIPHRDLHLPLLSLLISSTILIIITRTKPAYSWQGLAGSWGEDTDQKGVPFGKFSTSHIAPPALSSGLNQPRTINESWKPDLEP